MVTIFHFVVILDQKCYFVWKALWVRRVVSTKYFAQGNLLICRGINMYQNVVWAESTETFDQMCRNEKPMDWPLGSRDLPVSWRPKRPSERARLCEVMGAVKTFTLKMKLAKKIKQNRPGIFEDCEDMKLLTYIYIHLRIIVRFVNSGDHVDLISRMSLSEMDV